MAITIREDNTGVILTQAGIGVPTHISPKSSVFFDLNTAIAYINKNGAAQWSYLLDSTMISGGTFGTDTYVTGGTYNNVTGVATFTNNTGGTFNVSGFNSSSGATDVFVTGGTPNNSGLLYTFTNNTGGTFNILGLTDVRVTGGTYSNGTAIYTNNTGGTFSVGGFLTGVTIPTDIFTTGGTPNNAGNTYTFTNNTGGTFTTLGIGKVYVSGGTYSNGTITLTNTTGGTFSVTGLGILSGATDIFTTGGTYNNSLGTATFINNSGGTFSVTGFTTGGTSGVNVLNVIGSSPNASGATISGSVLTLQPASATYGGVVTTTGQTFSGDKTFASTLFTIDAGTQASTATLINNVKSATNSEPSRTLFYQYANGEMGFYNYLAQSIIRYQYPQETVYIDFKLQTNNIVNYGNFGTTYIKGINNDYVLITVDARTLTYRAQTSDASDGAQTAHKFHTYFDLTLATSKIAGFSNGLGGSDVFAIYKNGNLQASTYGVGTYTGTPTYNLTVDSTGNMIETSLPQSKRVTTQVDVTGTTLTNVTGFTTNVVAGKTYMFAATLFLTSSSSGGVKFAISGTTTATNIVYGADVTSFNAPTTILSTTIGGVVGDVTATTPANFITKINGTITVNTSGTLVLQFAQNASFATPSSILVGSTFIVTEIP